MLIKNNWFVFIATLDCTKTFLLAFVKFQYIYFTLSIKSVIQL